MGHNLVQTETNDQKYNLDCGKCKKTIHYTSEDVESVHDIPYVECKSCYSIINLNQGCEDEKPAYITIVSKAPKDKLISANRVQSFLSAVLQDREEQYRDAELESAAYHKGFKDAIKACQEDLVYKAGVEY